MDKLEKMVDNEIACIEENGITEKSLDNLGKLVDIKKDIHKIKKLEEESDMAYERGYGRRRRDSRGRYMENGGSYGRNSYGTHDEEMFDKMKDGYEGYREGMDDYRRGGNYGAKDAGLESLEYMLQSVVDFFEYIQNETDSQEEMELVKKYARKIKEM